MHVSLSSLALTRNLQKFERQLAAVPAIQSELRGVMDIREAAPFVQAKLAADRHFHAMAQCARRIRAGVVGVDDLGGRDESLSELVLRAIRLVVLSELTILREMGYVPPAANRRRASVGSVAVDLVDGILRVELDRITDEWRRHRPTSQSDRGAYRIAHRAAHQAMRALRRRPEVSRFLDVGIRQRDLPAVQDSCARMADALELRIDVEPDTPLWVASWTVQDTAAMGAW